ncbi:NYN domain-containing protein [Corynebacterium sp.]|uniref:NYN domain-containing protein n=1 Tax=Corynebacterium sp. TaxID=1720 RepID=UPI003735C527
MLERTLVFVDTSYLLASFYNSWETGARSQLEIDLPEVVAVLGNMITNQLHQPIHRQNWYDGIPDSGPHRYQRALRGCDGVQLRTGSLIEWGDRRTQKAVDTRLVADMVTAACRSQVSDFVLVSGDADMIPGVQEASNNGVRVHLYGFGWDSMSSALRHSCDTTTILDPREDFAEAMQLQVLEGPLPPSIRERPLGDAEPLEEPGMKTVPGAVVAGATARVTPPAPTPKGTATAAPADADADPGAGAGAEGEDKAAAEEPAAEASPDTPTTTPAATPRPMPKPGDLAGTPPRPGPVKKPETPAVADEIDDYDDFEPSEVEAELANHPPETPKPGAKHTSAPKPSMMAPRRKLRSRYVPLPEEVWASAGFQTPFDVGQQYATWWYENAATSEQRDQAHLLSGGGLPPEIDRPLLQFACETLHEYTLSESQRVNLRDGFHSGIRGVLIIRRD